MKKIGYIACLCLVALTCTGAGDVDALRKVESRTRYETNAGEGRFEATVVRWYLDHEMNSTALLRYSSVEVAELRGLRLFGKYTLEESSDEEIRYRASVFASDADTERYVSSIVHGVKRGIVVIRILSQGITEEEHRLKVKDLIIRFEKDEKVYRTNDNHRA
jgi:hypothetical protein